MKQFISLFFPSLGSFRKIVSEIPKTSISRVRFIDFLKVTGLMLIIFNTSFFLDFKQSSGEFIIYNRTLLDNSLTPITWITAGMALFFFSTGFTNKIAWYSNVGRDGSQWKFLSDRVNGLMGSVLVWVFFITLSLNVISKLVFFPLFITNQEDGIITVTEFIMWPLWLVSIYLVVVLFCPLTIYFHKKNPYLTLSFLIFSLVLIDNIELSISLSYIKLFNYLIFWLTIHQLGYFLADGKIFSYRKSLFAAISFVAYSYLGYLHITTDQFLSVTNYRLLSLTNEDPPTTVYLISSIGLLSLILFFRSQLENLLTNRLVWSIFSIIHANIYTLFLWHIALFFFMSYFNVQLIYYPLIVFLIVFLFGNYERKTFRLSRELIKRVNPLQPWPTPIKARLSYSNFLLAWISSILVLIGIFQITLGGVGLSGFFSLRQLYIFSGNTFEAFIRIVLGLILLNVTIRRKDLKNQLLIIGITSQIITLGVRIQLYDIVTPLELYMSIFLISFFLILIFNNRNYKSMA
ncbi:hypothetical protein N9851_01115 [Acidimicrobiia bacterium]|jgi:hypothetical protein|nr:hypothetical protein [Acidimicrobiia bacterium]|tara:strand:+ start:14451 stop:16004 length:1554 start_codon:yes stop_codon:yes gene_type:complete